MVDNLPSVTERLTPIERRVVRDAIRQAGRPPAVHFDGGALPVDEVRRIMARPHVRAALHAEIQNFINTELAPKAAVYLSDIMGDDSVPTALRITVARDSLDRAGHVKPSERVAPVDKPISEMSPEELVEVIRRAELEKSNKAIVVIDCEKEAPACAGAHLVDEMFG